MYVDIWNNELIQIPVIKEAQFVKQVYQGFLIKQTIQQSTESFGISLQYTHKRHTNGQGVSLNEFQA